MFYNLGITSWHDAKQERKPLNRRNPGVPDVYPQGDKQEEDSMNPQRLKSGYISIIPPYEQDTLFKMNRFDKFAEDGLLKCAKLISQVMQNKKELNSKILSRQRNMNKDGSSSQQFIHHSKTKERAQWFVDLQRMKSFIQLSRKQPFIKKKEECFELLFEYRVPIPRAIWFLKLHTVSQMPNSNSSKGKQKNANDLCYPEQSSAIIRVIADTVVKLNDFSSSDSSRVITYWNYLVNLFKHSYEEGLVDRQDFIMDLTELLQSQANYPMDKPFAFRFLLFFFCHFIKTVTQNVILARRVAHIVASRLRLYQMEYEKLGTKRSETETWYTDLLICQHHRPIIYSLTGIMHAIVLDCPQALIWNSFQVCTNQSLPNQLCGSPLDVLPCTPDELPLDLPAGPERDSVIGCLKSKLSEVKRRSWAVKRLWALNSTDENTFTTTVDRVLRIITALDTIDLKKPLALRKAYVLVFGAATVEEFEYQTPITIKLMIQWAVTAQRGGTYRISVVIALIKQLLARFIDPYLAPNTTIQDVLMEYLSNESPEAGATHIGKEYANLMLLFYDLQRAGIFSHDKYVQDLIRAGELNQSQPVMLKLREGNSDDKENAEERENAKESKETPKSKSDKLSKENAKTELIDDEPDHHILMSKHDNLTRHERFLIQLPIQQIESNRSERNQRLVMLYGIGEDREHASQTQKRVAENIMKIWQKKVHLEVPEAPSLQKLLSETSSKEASRELRFRRKPADNYGDAISTFKAQTYYDQNVISAICADSFLDMLSDFIFKGGPTIPTSESLDVLFYLMEYCMNINEIISISIELIPLLLACDEVMTSRQIPIIPGSFSAQHGHVIAAYLSSHYEYFLLHPEAPKLLRGMFKLVETQLRSKDKEMCMSAWARSIAVFMLEAKMDLLLFNNNVDLVGVGTLKDLKNVFPSADVPSTPPKYSNADRDSAFSEMMKDLKARRFMNYGDFKKKLALLNQSPGAGVQLILAAYTAAKDSGRRIEVLSDIATLVGHFAANKPLEGDIYVVIDELCCSQQCKEKILPSSSRLKTDDIEHLYAMATLTALLVAKHCISGHALILRLLQGIFKPFTSSPFPGTDKLEHMYRGLILGTLIISMLICGTELPFCVDPVKMEKAQERTFADIRGIRTLNIREFNDTLMPVLSIMILVAEPNKADDERASARTPWFKAPQYTTFIQPILKAAIRAICEQDWVNRSVFKICEVGKLDMYAKLKNQQGQKIIRFALRRKCERELKEELNNDHTVKTLVTKLFSSMNVWNIRAIIYDIRLMIKENEGKNEKGKDQFTHNQMLHFYDNLTQNIALACREFFQTLSPEKEKMYPKIKVGRGFQLNQINPLWLIAPLMQTCPQPGFNSTNSNHINVNSVQQKFLKEAQGMLNYQNYDHNRTWLLSQKPFLNLLYASLTGEEQLRDSLVTSVLKQFTEIANRARDSSGLSFSKQFKNEREGLIVRLALCGGMFESMLSTAESWAFELFKLLFYEVITEDRDPLVYEMCYDMLSTLIIYTIVESHQNFDGDDRSGGSKYSPQDEQSNQGCSLPNKYRALMKKLSKEIVDRSVPIELKDLFKLLPVPKPVVEVPVVDPFGCPPAANNSKTSKSGSSQFSSSSGGSSSSTVALRGPNARYGVQYNGRREQLTTFDFIQGYFAEHLPKHWKWSWFQGMKLDKVPMPMQKQVLRMLNHTHYLEYSRPAMVGLDRNPQSDIFLLPPHTEDTQPLPHNAPTPVMLGQMSVGSQQQTVPQMTMAMGQMMPQNAAGPSVAVVDPTHMMPGGPGMVPTNAVPTSMQQPPNAMHPGFSGAHGGHGAHGAHGAHVGHGAHAAHGHPPHGMPHPGMPGGMPGPHPEFGMRAPFPGKPMGMMNAAGMHQVNMMRGPHPQQVRAATAAAGGGRKRGNAGGPKATAKRRKDSKAQVAASMTDMQMAGPAPGYWPNTTQPGFPGPQQGFMGQPGAAGGLPENHGQDSKAQLHEMLLNRQKINSTAQHAQNAFGPAGPGVAPSHFPMMPQPDHQGGFTQSSGQTGQRYM